MNNSWEDQLRQIRPPDPQLDWSRLWIEMGKAQARRELPPPRWYHHPVWPTVSALSTALSCVLAVALLQTGSTERPGTTPSTTGMIAQSSPSPRTDSSASSDPETSVPRPDEIAAAFPDESLAAGQDPFWLGGWWSWEVRPEWQRRQQWVRFGEPTWLLDPHRSAPENASLDPREPLTPGTWLRSLQSTDDDAQPSPDSSSFSGEWL